MISDANLTEIAPASPAAMPSAAQVASGVPIPKAARVGLLSPDDWEAFVEEWGTSLFDEYHKVRRFGGSGDLGIDVAGFVTPQGFNGDWDNYQCKRYGHALRPSDIWVEIGKIIYYSFLDEYTPPRMHYFVCSKGIGTTLEMLLNSIDKLKEKSRENWDKHCKDKITDNNEVKLEGELLVYFDGFDFTIFSSKSVPELIEGHATTGYHAVRFGGGLPARPTPAAPPNTPSAAESRYIRQLLDAYGDHVGSVLSGPDDLEPHKALEKDYLRQRERFYHAESLRNFARDTVPEGTFDALQDEVHQGVVDICEDAHNDGFARMKATLNQSTQIAITANPLAPATKTQDRQGICHQLANNDRLTWVPEE
jgi:hypothetical protein